MKIKKLILENFKQFSSIEIDFPDSNVVVLIGNNGAGKTTLLDAISLCFTHFTGELISNTEAYDIDSWFLTDYITFGANYSKATVLFNLNFPPESQFYASEEQINRISITKERNSPGFNFEKTPKNFVNRIKERIIKSKLSNIPILANYNVNRTCTIEFSKKAEKKTYDEKLNAYQGAMNIILPSFDSFEKWFIKQVISENATKVAKKNLDYKLQSLENVRNAFNRFMKEIAPEIFSELRIESDSNNIIDFSQDIIENLYINKNSTSMKVNLLSSGERMIIGLVCDIARRLTIANENSENALDGQGIVLIDELELHLHPNWQRTIVSALTSTFINIQFIFTSHSPLVLSGMKRENIIMLNNGEIIPYEELPDIYSATADEILEKILLAENAIDDYRIQKKEIDALFNKLDFISAEKKLNELKSIVKSLPQWLKDYEQRISFVK
ncbi:MAG: AAA family ATPase [Saprospiraceae bacterium]|nr:AAA family ATPase [Candidatus Defluviibacterium haderslevense]